MHTVLLKNIFQKSRFCQNIAICYNNECSIKYKKSSRIFFIETILNNIRFVCTHINCCYSTQHFVKINTINTTFSQMLNFIKLHAKHLLTTFCLFSYLWKYWTTKIITILIARRWIWKFWILKSVAELHLSKFDVWRKKNNVTIWILTTHAIRR